MSIVRSGNAGTYSPVCIIKHTHTDDHNTNNIGDVVYENTIYKNKYRVDYRGGGDIKTRNNEKQYEKQLFSLKIINTAITCTRKDLITTTYCDRSCDSCANDISPLIEYTLLPTTDIYDQMLLKQYAKFWISLRHMGYYIGHKKCNADYLHWIWDIQYNTQKDISKNAPTIAPTKTITAIACWKYKNGTDIWNAIDVTGRQFDLFMFTIRHIYMNRCANIINHTYTVHYHAEKATVTQVFILKT